MQVAVVPQGLDDDGGFVGCQRQQDRLVALDAVARPVVAGLFARVHRHRQLEFEQDGLECDVELTVVGQAHHGRMEDAMRIVTLEIIGGRTHLGQRRADGVQGRRGIGKRQRGLDGVAFQHVPQRLTPGAIRILRLHRRADTSKAQLELGYKPGSIRQAGRS